MARVQDVLCLVTALFETFLLAGTLYGWPSMVEVLTSMGYFMDTCLTSEILTNKNMTSANLSFSSVESSTARIESNTRELTGESNPKHRLTDRCANQEESLNFAFSLSASALQISSFFYGILLDNWGTWITKTIGIASVSVGLLSIILSTPNTSWLIYLGLPLFVTGGASLNRSNIQVANLFPRIRNSIITLISSSYFASGSIFLIIKTAFNNGIAFKTSLFFMLGMTALSWIRTFFLMPRKHFLFPSPPDPQGYGLIHECKKITTTTRSLSQKNLDSDSNSDVSCSSSSVDVNDVEAPRSNQFSKFCSNMKSFKRCVMTSIFWTSTFQVLILEFRTYFYFGTFNASLVRLAGESQLDYYTSLFGVIVICGAFITPLHGFLIDFAKNKFEERGDKNLAAKKALLVSTLLTNTIALVMSVAASIPALNIQVFVFIFVILLRVFSLTNDFLFLTTMYPVEQFGKLLGLHSFIFGVLNFTQAPLLKLILSYYEGDFTVVNLVFVLLSVIIFLHPYKLYTNIKTTTKQVRRDESKLKLKVSCRYDVINGKQSL